MANNVGIPQNRLVAGNLDTAAAPSVQFGGTFDLGSGMGMFADANSIHFSVGGSDKLVISATAITLGTGVSLGSIQVFTSAAGGGGSANQVFVVAGLLASDTILSVSQKTPGAAALPILGYSTQANNALTGIYSADPGAGSVIIVAVKR